MRCDHSSITQVLEEDKEIRNFVRWQSITDDVKLYVMTPATARIMCDSGCSYCKEFIDTAELCHLNVFVVKTRMGWDAQATMSGDTSEACKYL